MVSYNEFEQELHTALCHLYDPDYQPGEALCAVIGCDPGEEMPAAQTAILRAIKSLEPPPNTSLAAPARQVYDLLRHRFVLQLTQEETAYRLYVSRRTVNRLQHKAVHALVGALWEHSQTVERVAEGLPESDDKLPTEDTLSDTQQADWHSQVQRELDSLQAKAPNASCDVKEVIGSVLDLVDPMFSKLGICTEVRSVQPSLVAAIHPVLLYQVLISALRRFAPYVSEGQISIYARLEDGNARITLTGATTVTDRLSEREFTDGIPISKGISIEACVDGTQAFVWISVPSMGKITVLVVDDNEDMVRFYRDCAIGTAASRVRPGAGSSAPSGSNSSLEISSEQRKSLLRDSPSSIVTHKNLLLSGWSAGSCAEMTKVGTSGIPSSWLMDASTCQPSVSGITMSSSIKSGGARRSCSSASWPLEAVTTSRALSHTCSIWLKSTSTSGSSSTRRTRLTGGSTVCIARFRSARVMGFTRCPNAPRDLARSTLEGTQHPMIGVPGASCPITSVRDEMSSKAAALNTTAWAGLSCKACVS